MSAAFVPVLSDLKQRPREEWLQYVNSFFTVLSAVLAVVVVAGVLLSPWLVPGLFAPGYVNNPEKMELTIRLTQVCFLYLFFIGLASFVQGILNTFKIFGPSAFTPVLLNLATIACAVAMSPLLDEPAYAFVIGFVVGGVAQLAFQLPYLGRLGVKLRPVFGQFSRHVWRSLKLMGPAVIGFGVYEVNVTLSQLVASFLGDGAISSLQYSNRMMELPLGVFVAAVSTVILPTLSEKGHQGDHEGYRNDLVFAIKVVLFLTLPVTAMMFILREPLFTLLLGYGAFNQKSVEVTAFAFMFHVVGLPLVGLCRILVPGFYALEDTKSPVLVALVSMVVNVVMCAALALFTDLGNGGIALASSLAALAQALGLLWLLKTRRRILLPYRALGVSMGKLLLAMVPLSLVCGYAVGLTHDVSRVTLGVVLAGAGTLAAVGYGVSLVLLKAEEVRFIRTLLRRRAVRSGRP